MEKSADFSTFFCFPTWMMGSPIVMSNSFSSVAYYFNYLLKPSVTPTSTMNTEQYPVSGRIWYIPDDSTSSYNGPILNLKPGNESYYTLKVEYINHQGSVHVIELSSNTEVYTQKLL